MIDLLLTILYLFLGVGIAGSMGRIFKVGDRVYLIVYIIIWPLVLALLSLLFIKEYVGGE